MEAPAASISASRHPPEQIQEIKEKFLQEVERVLNLGAENASQDTFVSTVQRFTSRLKRVQNPNQALVSILALSTTVGNSTRREGKGIYVSSQHQQAVGVLGCLEAARGFPQDGLPLGNQGTN